MHDKWLNLESKTHIKYIWHKMCVFLNPGRVQQSLQMDESQVGFYCNAGQRAVQVGHMCFTKNIGEYLWFIMEQSKNGSHSLMIAWIIWTCTHRRASHKTFSQDSQRT